MTRPVLSHAQTPNARPGSPERRRLDISAIFIGDPDRAEFGGAAALLREKVKTILVADCAEANAMFHDRDDGFSPDLIVLAQSRPGQYAPDDVARLREEAPLARIVGLLGPMCEGEMRTGTPLPGVIRVYWHQWPERCEYELEHLAQGRGSSWSLPLTAGEEERIKILARNPLPSCSGLVAIDADRQTAGALLEFFGATGCSAVWLAGIDRDKIQGVSAILWDGSARLDEAPRRIATLARQFPKVPIIALLDFPRPADVRAVRRAGAVAVVSKPYLVDELVRVLKKALS